MTTREVVLDGGSPWGFRLHGGADQNQPLRISRVNPGSKAALRGIREGDFITSINNQSTKDITNAEAHTLLRNSGDTLKLGLNEDCNGSPKRRQYKTVHQETHSEIVKKSSITSYTVTSSKTISEAEASNELRASKVNGNTTRTIADLKDPEKPPIVSQRSTLSSTCSSGSSTPSTYTSLTSPSGTDMADSARSRRKRTRNNRKKNHSNANAAEANEIVVEEAAEYRVESPKRVRSPAIKKPVKSRSFDDDQVKIQELSEVSESEDKSECKAIISEAESDVDWEMASTMEELETPQPQTSTVALSLDLEECTTEQAQLISPEEELTLRNFLEGLNLVNSPEDAFKQVRDRELNTVESIKARRARKRAVLEQYFFPMMQNPRFLEVISEETSDLSDREQPSLTHHLKQGTPEPEVPQRPPRRRKEINNPTILVSTKIVDVSVCSTSTPQPSSDAEIVYLEDSSNSTTPDPNSDNEEDKDTTVDILSSTNSSAPDLRETETAEETKQVKVTLKKDDLLVSSSDRISREIKSTPSKSEILGAKSSIVSELTPPLTPENEQNATQEVTIETNKAVKDVREYEEMKPEDNLQTYLGEGNPKNMIITPHSIESFPIIIPENEEKEKIKNKNEDIKTSVVEDITSTHISDNFDNVESSLRQDDCQNLVGDEFENKNVLQRNEFNLNRHIKIVKLDDTSPPTVISPRNDRFETSSKASRSDSASKEAKKGEESESEPTNILKEAITTEVTYNFPTTKETLSPIYFEKHPSKPLSATQLKSPPQEFRIPITIETEIEELRSSPKTTRDHTTTTEKTVFSVDKTIKEISTGKSQNIIGPTFMEKDFFNRDTKTKIEVSKETKIPITVEKESNESKTRTSSSIKSNQSETEGSGPSSGLQSSPKEVNIPISFHVEGETKASFPKEIIVPITMEDNSTKTETIPNVKTSPKETIIPITLENNSNSNESKFKNSVKMVFEDKNVEIPPPKEFVIPVFVEKEVIKKKIEQPEISSAVEIIIPISFEMASVKPTTNERRNKYEKFCNSKSLKKENLESTSAPKRKSPTVDKIHRKSPETQSLKKNIETASIFKDPTSPVQQVSVTAELESPSKEIETICHLKAPESIFYSNVLSPPAASPSPSLSSGSSSRATSLCTAKYNPMSSSIADMASIKEFPPTLRDLCVNFLMSLPFGTDVLQELADVSSSIEHLTKNLMSPVNVEEERWVGLPTEEDPRLLVCLSPTQKSELEKSRKVENEASRLLDLHSKFINRTSYHDDGQAKTTDVSNRLLAIVRDAEEPKTRKFSTLPRDMETARLKAKDLSEWLELARNKSRSNVNLTKDENRPQERQRRTSLPHDLYARQMQYLREKEREIQRELEMLEAEKWRLTAEMVPSRFKEEDFHISKKGDFAENKRSRPLSMPVSTEFFRQQMYEEYMGKMAEREERKQQKVIRVKQIENTISAKTATGIEDEFMSKVREKQKLGKLKREEESDQNEDDEKMPKHLQEFMDIAQRTEDDPSDSPNEMIAPAPTFKATAPAPSVWSPGQKPDVKPERTQRTQASEVKNEPVSPVWTPKSATSSPTVERKEFRPVKFESPVLSRKNYSRNEDRESSEGSAQEPPWKVPETSSDTGIILSSTLKKRLPTSYSSPASGFSDFPTTRLPKAQNPTITLLQKAREGQLPKGAFYIEQEEAPKRSQNDKPPLVGPGEILYKIKNEYTSESDGEKPRKMADLGPRKYEGIGPTTKDGMPLILRSEIKDANQSKWYKKMYDTIHKQKPHRDEYVTVKYKQRRGQYPYTSGYLSEPEPGAYDSDFADYKYATLDRRRANRDRENDYVVSSTMPRSAPDKGGSSVIKHGHEPYKNQPGRIENYIPGHSSISEKEAKEWWDEVMDIFDGWLDDNSALPSYDYMFTRALAKSHLEQQKRVPQTKSFMNQALKESGYESDSTLVFRRRDDTAQQLSPSEQKEAYKIIQRGGDIPLHGLRKPAPERPKEEPRLEYFSISPTLTRIRVHKNVKPHKEIFCYPVTVHPHPSTVFAHVKRTAPSTVSGTPKPPSPPRRRSSRNNSTLRLISTMKVKSEKSPICKRHETCFTTTSNIDNTKVKYLRDKITCKLTPVKSKDGGTKPKLRVSKVVSASPELRSRIVSTLSTSKDSKTSVSRIQSRTNIVGTNKISERCCSTANRSQSLGSIRKPCKKCTTRAESLERTKFLPPQTRTFGSEKRKVDLVLPKIKRSTLVSSPDLLSPTEVKKAVESQKNLPTGTVFKRTNAVLASAKNNQSSNLKDTTIPIKVGISEKGKAILKYSTQKPSSIIQTKVRTKSLSPVPCSSTDKPKHKISLESLGSPTPTRKTASTVSRTIKPVRPKTITSSDKKLKKSRKEEINGEIVKKDKFVESKEITKCAGRAAGTEIAKKLREMEDFGSTDTLADIKRQKEAIQTDYFFQHLFLRDIASPTPSQASRSSWLVERAQQLQKQRSSAEPTIGAMKVYLKHTRPVTDSKFRSLDVALRSRSASPRSVTWETGSTIEKRSSSLPPRLVFSQTSRPVSPRVERRVIKSPTPPQSPRLIRSPSSRRIMHLKGNIPIERTTEGRESPRLTKEVSIYSCPSISHSSSSVDSYDRKEYQNYVKELLRSSRKSSRFKDLNEFYSAIEKFGQLEQTTSSQNLKPRRRYEDEIIDYDRWREVRTRERAEKELEALVNQLKRDSKEKGFVFTSKEIEAYRWKKEFDRGLRIKEKSVDNIKEEFEKLKEEESERENARRREIESLKDTYKPLWRGDSVLGLATKMTEKRSQSEGRVSAARQKLIDSERMLTHGIGSRLWSSLSSEQVNILKNQLSQIYSHNLQKKKEEPTVDYSIQVPNEKIIYKSPLTVRRNSDTSDYMCKTPEKYMSEDEKRQLSQTLSKEVIDHVSKKRKDAALPLVLAKETRGAVAAAMSRSCPSELLKCSGTETAEEPSRALVVTDAVTPKMQSASEAEETSGSTDESNKTVIHVQKEDIKKKVEYFENVAEQEKYSPTIYKASESHYDFGDNSSVQSKSPSESSFQRKSITSQSYQNLKELFGETELMKLATVPLSATRKEAYISPERPQLRVSSMRVPSPPISEATSIDSFYRSRSLSPYFDEPLAIVKSGEVRRLRNKFEYPNLTYPPRTTFYKPRRCRSDSSLYKLTQMNLPKPSTSGVELLRSKYEYPAHAGRGRSRIRRGGVVSPTFLRAEDRFMPHINIISKIANLYARKSTQEEKSRSMEELAKILGCPVGEVEKLRQKFDSNISLLGHMFTSSPNIKELRDIAPYLAASWIAHRYPRAEDNTRSLSSPEGSTGSRDTSLVRKDRQRPKSSSPIPKKSSILKSRKPQEKFDAKTQPLSRYQPEPVRYKSWWTSTQKPSVSFKEPEPPVPPPKGHHGIRNLHQESPRKYVENEVTIHYKTPVRQEIKECLSEDELAHRQAEAMKKIYQEERRRKYLQVSKSLQELQDMNNRRHTDNFIPSQKSPIPLNRYDDFDDLSPPVKPRPRSPEPRLMARALYNFVGQTARELTFRKGDLIYVRRQVDKNWYEGELNAMVGLFPVNYVEIVPFDTAKSTPRKSHEGQARAKYNFVAQSHLELSLAKGELVVITRRVDDNWYEGKIGGRKGIFPVTYVEVLIDPSDPPPPSTKPVAAPAAHSLLLNGSAGGKESMGSHSYTPSLSSNQLTGSGSYHAKPVQVTGYGSLGKGGKNPVNQTLHIETQSEPVPYRALYKYLPQNDDELELLEGDTVYVLEKCDDGWYVGSSERTGAFGTFPGNYVEKI